MPSNIETLVDSTATTISMTNTMPTYVSSTFQDTGQLGQQRLNVEFKKYLMQKYGYPETSGGVMCFPDTTESGARARQHDRVQYTKNVVDTGWKPAG